MVIKTSALLAIVWPEKLEERKSDVVLVAKTSHGHRLEDRRGKCKRAESLIFETFIRH